MYISERILLKGAAVEGKTDTRQNSNRYMIGSLVSAIVVAQ